MKRILLFVPFAFAFAICFCAMTTQAQAQASRTWVSGVGDDVNPCSRTAPCKTFAGAYSKTAAGGEIDALDPGGFGVVTIGKSLTIDGGGGQVASILGSSTNGLNVAAGPNDRVTLRHLRINGINGYTSPGLTGISFTSGLALNIEHCFIFGFAGPGIDFEPNVRAFLNVFDTVVANNNTGVSGLGGAGIISSSAASGGGVNRVMLQNVEVVNNGGSGVANGQNSRMVIRETLVHRNGIVAGGDFGIFATGANSEVNIEHSLITNNNNGGLHTANTAIMRANNSDIEDNAGPGMQGDAGTQLLTYSNNRVQGNVSPGAFTGTATNM